jgi:hypothetical protein
MVLSRDFDFVVTPVLRGDLSIACFDCFFDSQVIHYSANRRVQLRWL